VVTRTRSSITRTCSFTDDDYMMSVDDVAKVLKLLGLFKLDKYCFTVLSCANCCVLVVVVGMYEL
jgi:hypothetical protein